MLTRHTSICLFINRESNRTVVPFCSPVVVRVCICTRGPNTAHQLRMCTRVSCPNRTQAADVTTTTTTHSVCTHSVHVFMCCVFLCIAVNEMLQTAKLFARRGSSLEPNVGGNSKRVNGLTFGEFCVLAADLKRFRTNPQQQQQNNQQPPPSTVSPLPSNSNNVAASSSSGGGQHSRTIPEEVTTTTTTTTDGGRQTFYNGAAAPGTPGAPEVFLGGSCNPTTWRADVAIPALDRLGISFYNPVSVNARYCQRWSLHRGNEPCNNRSFSTNCSKSPTGRPTSSSWSTAPRRRLASCSSSWTRKRAHRPAPSRRPTLPARMLVIWCWCCIRTSRSNAF